MRYLLAIVLALWITSVLAMDDSMFMSAEKHTSYQPALDDLSAAILDHGYTPIKIQPVDQGLRKKGYDASDYKVIFFGKKSQVDKVLAIHPAAAVMLPLKIILYHKGDVVVASAPRLEMWKGVFHKKAINDMIDQWQKDLAGILKEYAGK